MLVCKSNNSEEDTLVWSDSANWIVIVVIESYSCVLIELLCETKTFMQFKRLNRVSKRLHVNTCTYHEMVISYTKEMFLSSEDNNSVNVRLSWNGNPYYWPYLSVSEKNCLSCATWITAPWNYIYIQSHDNNYDNTTNNNGSYYYY